MIFLFTIKPKKSIAITSLWFFNVYVKQDFKWIKKIYKFNVKKTIFLEIIISNTNLRMDFKKIEIIFKWATPKCLKNVQNFVSFVNFYRKFIFEFSKFAKSLILLIKKNVSFVWNEIYEKVFETLKKQINTASILRYFNLNKQSIFEIDSSDYVIEDIFFQYNNKKKFHSMIFYNKSIILIEYNYHIYNKELLIIIRYLEHWRPKLEYIELLIQIFTDH